MVSRIQFKYWENISISGLYKHFREMTPKWLQNGCPKKFQNFKNMNILYTALKHGIWRFRICNYFREIFKCREFMNTLRNFAKSIFAIFTRNLNISRDKAKQFILTESPDHML